MWTPPTHIHLPKMMLAGSLAGTQAGGLTHGGHTSRCPDAWQAHKQVASRMAGTQAGALTHGGYTSRWPHAWRASGTQAGALTRRQWQLQSARHSRAAASSSSQGQGGPLTCASVWRL